ncbi:probable G-protein coupled receptor 139 [Heterodontus francisci]|uniref:probable G-protein coupled receptor 139 n=1 Tax=Heterodontus francisci TaxID=7792 RepID=UPI00355C6011
MRPFPGQFPSTISCWDVPRAPFGIDLLSLHSLTVNLLAIVILSRGKCGLSTCTTRYLVAMATADLLVIITEVILLNINHYYFPVCFLDITPVCSVINVLIRAAIDCSVWFTVIFTFDRFVAICCQKLKTKYCTKKTAAVVLATTCILLCSKNIPIYFRYEPGEIIDNVPWRCYIKRSYYTEPGWVGFRKFDKVLTPVIPFALILLLNALTVRHILVTSRVRKGLRGQSKGENRSDPEMESRRKSVILLFTISGNFILLCKVPGNARWQLKLQDYRQSPSSAFWYQRSNPEIVHRAPVRTPRPSPQSRTLRTVSIFHIL